MDLTKSTDEILDDLCRVVYEKLYGTGKKGLDAYLAGISEELDERNIQHDTNKKCMDKHTDKYFKIDVLIPPMERFIMLKHRKHITRADMNQFRQQEISVGVKGLLVNFYNGVDVREATSLLPGEEKRELAKQNPRLKGGLGGPRSSSVDKLPGIGSDHKRFVGSRSWGGSSSQVTGPTASHQQISSTPATANVDFSRIFAASCASFFISEGDRSTFASSFNDFLTLMSIKRIAFPRKHIMGGPLQKPEGVLNENLEHFFKTSSIASSLRKKTPDDDTGHSNPPTSPSETRGSVVTSSTYRKLPAIGSSSPPPRHKSEHFHVATLGLPSIKRPPPPLDVVGVFATACASFFLTEGDQEDFIYVFADFLRTTTAANLYGAAYGTRYTSKYNTFRRKNQEEVIDDVDQLRLPSKRVIRNLRTILIGDKVEGESEEENHGMHSELDQNSLMPINAD